MATSKKSKINIDSETAAGLEDRLPFEINDVTELSLEQKAGIDKVLNIAHLELDKLGYREQISIFHINPSDLPKLFGEEKAANMTQTENNSVLIATEQEGYQAIALFKTTNVAEMLITILHEVGHVATGEEFIEREEHEILLDELSASVWAMECLFNMGVDREMLSAAAANYATALHTYSVTCASEEIFLDGMMKFVLKASEIIQKAGSKIDKTKAAAYSLELQQISLKERLRQINQKIAESSDTLH